MSRGASESTAEAPRGVGGWLAFLVMLMLAVTPLVAISATVAAAAAPGAEERIGGTALIWVIGLVQAGAFAFAGWRLRAVWRWSSVRLAIAVWWLAGPVMSLAYGGAVTALTGGGASILPILIDVARTAIVAAIWTAYLLRSRRVRNTYAAS